MTVPDGMLHTLPISMHAEWQGKAISRLPIDFSTGFAEVGDGTLWGTFHAGWEFLPASCALRTKQNSPPGPVTLAAKVSTPAAWPTNAR